MSNDDWPVSLARSQISSTSDRSLFFAFAFAVYPITRASTNIAAKKPGRIDHDQLFILPFRSEIGKSRCGWCCFCWCCWTITVFPYPYQHSLMTFWAFQQVTIRSSTLPQQKFSSPALSNIRYDQLDCSNTHKPRSPAKLRIGRGKWKVEKREKIPPLLLLLLFKYELLLIFIPLGNLFLCSGCRQVVRYFAALLELLCSLTG